MMRVVVDTNIIISATFWRGLPFTVLQNAENGLYRLLTSDDLAQELKETLNKRKFVRAFSELGITPEDVLDLFLAHAQKVIPAEIPDDAVRDVKDIPVLACAVGGQADLIVSGDKDLLSLSNYANIPIFTAARFLERLVAR